MKLTENFNREEFDCKDGSKMPDSVLVNVKELAKNLQAEGGLGSYNSFTHYDIRGTKARWSL